MLGTLYIRPKDLEFSKRKMAKLFANSEDPDQMLHSAASDLGLHCLPITLLWVSLRQWVMACDTQLNPITELVKKI